MKTQAFILSLLLCAFFVGNVSADPNKVKKEKDETQRMKEQTHQKAGPQKPRDRQKSISEQQKAKQKQDEKAKVEALRKKMETQGNMNKMITDINKSDHDNKKRIIDNIR
jgi:hypothetical protein